MERFSTDREQQYAAFLLHKKKCLEEEFQEVWAQYHKSTAELEGIQEGLAKNKILLKRFSEGFHIKKSAGQHSFRIKNRLFFSLTENQMFLERMQETLQKDVDAQKEKLLPYAERKRSLEAREEIVRSSILEKRKSKRAVQGVVEQSEREELYYYENR